MNPSRRNAWAIGVISGVASRKWCHALNVSSVSLGIFLATSRLPSLDSPGLPIPYAVLWSLRCGRCEAGEAIAAQDGKAVYLYYLGDHDPSGLDIARNVERELRRFAPFADIHFVRLAVTSAQVRRWNLPTRPTKRTDTRARRFHGESVEVDAIPPKKLRALVRRAIERHVDRRALGVTLAIEEEERRLLAVLPDGLGKAGHPRSG